MSIRIVLIEFAVNQSFHRAQNFAHILGLSKEIGCSCDWLRFGKQREDRSKEEERGVTITSQEMLTISQYINSKSKFHVVLSHLPENNLLDYLRTNSDSTIYVESLLNDSRDLKKYNLKSVNELYQIIFKDSMNEYSHLGCYQYEWINCNDLASEIEPVPFISSGVDCSYNRSYKNNPFFENLEMNDCLRSGGCSFCMKPPNEFSSKFDLEDVFKQIEAINNSETLKQYKSPLKVRFSGDKFLPNIVTICHRLLEINCRSLIIALDARTDAIITNTIKLNKACQILLMTNHIISLSLIGVESFSPRLLEIYNKGTTIIQNINCIALLFLFYDLYPRNFDFLEDSGLSMIFYTPWTTFEDLSLDYGIIDFLKIDNVFGKLLTAKLRLYKESPLYEKAYKEELLVDRYDVDSLDTAQLNFYDKEEKWKFYDERVQDLFLNMMNSESATQVLEKIRSIGFGEESFVSIDDESVNAEEWLSCSAENEKFENTRIGLFKIKHLLELKRVIKIEPLKDSEVDELNITGLQAHYLIRKRATHASDISINEMFVGKYEEDVQKAVFLTNRLEEVRESIELKQIIKQLGELLGYPLCCAARFAVEPSVYQINNFYLHVRRRLESKGEIDPRFSPHTSSIEYIPCSLDCPASIQRMEKMENLYLHEYGTSIIIPSRNIILIFKSLQSAYVEITCPENPLCRFPIHVVSHSSNCDDARLVLASDEIEITDYEINLYKNGHFYGSLTTKSYPWWYKQALQVDFWNSLLLTKHIIYESYSPSNTNLSPTPLVKNTVFKPLVGFLKRAKKSQISFMGYDVSDIVIPNDESCIITLVSGNNHINILIEESAKVKKYLWKVEPYAISYPKNEAPVNSEAWEVIHYIANTIKWYLNNKRLAPKD